MSHVEGGPLAGYNSLIDPHLSGFYTNSRMRKHLIKSGLITKRGHIVSENTYRLNMARKEHKKHVRDMLAQAIVHKTLDMERGRQVAIKQKLEEIAKIELVRRVKSDRARKGDEDILPYLEPSKRKSRSQSRRSSEASSTGQRPKSAPSRSQRKRSRSSDNRSRNGRGSIDESGSQRSRPWSASSNGSTNRSKSGRNSRAQSAKYPHGEVDDKHLYSLNQEALHEYTMGQYNMDSNRGPSPYTYSQLPPDMVHEPSPPPQGTPRSGHRRGRHGKQGGRSRRDSPENKGSLMLHRSEPAMKHQERVQTMCDVSMHYFGKSIRLDYERFDPRDEVTIEQQHCGGNTLIVFRERIIPGSDFTFTSRRHRGYPFSLTIYVNGLQYCRLSTCCEYKHPSGSRLGGTQGYFSIVTIEGAAPCYRCQARDSEPQKKRASKRKSAKKQDESDHEDNDEVEVDDDDSDQDDKDRAMENEEYAEESFEESEDDKDGKSSKSSSSRSSRSSSTGSSAGNKSSGSDNSERSRSPASDKSGRSRSPASDKSERSKSSGFDKSERSRSPASDKSGRSRSPTSDKSGRSRSPGSDKSGRSKSPGSDKSGRSGSPRSEKSSGSKSQGSDKWGRSRSPVSDKSSSSKSPESDNSARSRSPGSVESGKSHSSSDSSDSKQSVESQHSRSSGHSNKSRTSSKSSVDSSNDIRQEISSAEPETKTEDDFDAQFDAEAIEKSEAVLHSEDIDNGNVSPDVEQDEDGIAGRKLVLHSSNTDENESGKKSDAESAEETSEPVQKPVHKSKRYEDDFTDSEKTSSRGSSRSSSRSSSRNSSPRSTTSSSSVASAKNTYSEKDWSVKVYSSDVDKAGTDANVTMVLFGKDKAGKIVESDQVKLDNSGNNFERGKCDEFKVEISEVGTPYKLRIEQDGTGALPGWRLDRVELENLSSRKRYMFVCNRWLAEDEDDGATVREIPAEGDDIKDAAKSVKYTVSVYTSDKPNAGTDANIFVNLFGKGGSSGNRQLKKSQNKNKFEKGKMDVFTIEAVGLQEIQKIRVGHDGQSAGDGWYLDKIVVKPNDGSQGQLVYRCNRWLDVKEDDGQIVRDITIGSPMTEYLVSVHTGRKSGAGTDADVSITVYGENGDTGEIPLSKSRNNKNKFEKGKVDEFIIDADPLGKLEKIKIGHDGDRKGAGWFLTKVVVKPKDGSGSETTFPCDRWLDVDEDDGEIVRELYAEGTRRPPEDGMVPWYIKVYTSDKRDAGTDANVSMVLYGKNKDGDNVESNEISLDNRGNNFERGACDNFEEDLVDTGTPYKLKICHDGRSHSSSWHLDRVEMENLSTNKKYMFVCNRWLAPDGDDGASVWEIPAEGDDIVAAKLVQYDISVYTGDRQNAGTDANVFVNLIGSGGESGDRKLKKSQNKNKFEKGNVDTFTVEAVGLKTIEKIRIGHDGKRSGSGWFLNKVVVKPSDGQQLCFNCGRWLDADEDDRQIVRDLSISDDMTQYKVKVYTGSKWGAGTDANVFINIVGEDRETGDRPLTESNNTHKFEKGKVDEFSLDSERLGSLQKIRIGHDGDNAGDGWFLDKVVVTETNASPVEAICNRWLDVKEDDGEIARELYFRGVKAPSEHTGMVPWGIKVYTSDARGAGTDANITMVLFGHDKDGKTVTSDTITLDNKGDNFEKGACDTFDRETVNIGKPYKLRIGQDGTGSSPAWHLDRVEMENRSNNKKYMFVCNRWLADDEDDGATVREIPAEGDDIKRPETLVCYVVGVYTGSKWGAGTDANVSCTVIGDRGDTGERQLAMSQTHKNKFEKGNMDEFSIEAIDIGRPQLVRIGHDGSRSGEGWYLDKVVVRPNNETRGQIIFECDRWLDVNEDDGEIVRELSPNTGSTTISPSASRQNKSDQPGHKSDTEESTSESDTETTAQSTATKKNKRKSKIDRDFPSSASATSSSSEEDEDKKSQDSAEIERAEIPQGNHSHPDDRPDSVEVKGQDKKTKADSSASDSSSTDSSSSDTEEESRASSSRSPAMKDSNPNKFPTESVANQSQRHSDTSSSSSESVESDTRDNTSKQPNALWSTPDDTETDAKPAVTDEDRAGGHDPDELASDQTPRAVHLSRIGVTPGERYDGSIRPLVTDKSNIEIMSIDLNKEQVAELCELIQDHGEVESLVLRNTGLDDNDIEMLAGVMAQTPADDLQMLNLNCNAISASGAHHVVSILRSKSHLELLLLHNSPLGDLGIHTLVQGLLEVDGVKANNDSQIQQAARGIVTNVIQHAIESSAKDGDTKSRSSSDVSGGSAETERVVSHYEHTQKRGRLRLEHLDIGDCQISDRGMDAVGALVRANTAMNTLCLTGNKGVTAAGWRVLGEALKDNTQIETLTLDYTTLGDEGIMAFIDGFGGNKTIKSLDLEGNRIGDLGGKRLLDLVQACSNLDDITLMPGNHISVALLNSIKQVLAGRDK